MDFHLLVILSCLLVAGTAHDCDGGNHGIPCCPHYVNGDMSGGNELNIKFSPRTEVGCQNSCKVQHPSSIGVTQNNAGTSCYCEFGSPRLIGTSSYWKTCLFSTEISDNTTTTPATTSATSTTTNIIDDTTITSTPTTAAASTSPTEKRSSAGSPNNFLDAFYAQWTCNEKDELFNEYEMTSLIFKETLKIFIKMTEGNKLSNCYTNDVTRSTSNGPQVMYLYSSRNHMCNNTQHILTTFTTSDTQSSSNYVSCLLHHPTRITSTAFVATAVCANIYDKIDLSPAITSVTCLGDDGWEVHEGIGLDCWEDYKYKYEKLQPYPVDNKPHTLANCKDKCAQHSQCQAIIMPRAEIENGESTTCYMIKKINNIFSECTWGHTDTYNVYEKKDDCQYGNGANYTGSVSVTKSGLQCQKWSSQSPHEHPWGDLGDHNYCRNPNPIAGNGVWCYTTDSNVRSERCGVPVCGEAGGPTFLIVAGDHVLAESFDDIEKAKAKLMEVTTRSRLIAEVDSSGNLKRDPQKVGGQNQGGGSAAGFNKYWDDWDDINRMMDVAQRFLDGNTEI